MGNFCQNPTLPRSNVDQMANYIPNDERYKFYSGISTRYGDLTVLSEDKNTYIFVLKIENEAEIRVSLPVLNDVVHCAIHPNYKLQISKHILIDIYNNKQPENALINVKNQHSGAEYSMKIISFKGYNTITFKKGLEEIWAHKKISSGKESRYFLNLCDAFVYGVNPNKQALVFLFEKAETNLLNIAEYRRLANWQWTHLEKIKIIHNLLEACLRLKNLSISHRDIRPSNIFYISKSNNFVLGDFKTCRKTQDQEAIGEDDLLTVCGIEDLAEAKIKKLIFERKDIGLYNPQKVTYSGVMNVLKLLECLDPMIHSVEFHDENVKTISQMIERMVPFAKILKYIDEQSTEIPYNAIYLSEDEEISKLASKLLAKTYRKDIELCEFRVFQLLGYHKEFSQLAHTFIDKNFEEGRPLENAVLLKELGYFYEKNGSKGIQYFLNACVLFCKRAEQMIKYERFQDAQQNLKDAQQAYVKLTKYHDSPLNLIEIQRLNALLKTNLYQDKQAKQIMIKYMNYAAQKQLSIEKQMSLLLTSAIISKNSRDRNDAEEKLKCGLAICQNSAAFESSNSCALHKSSFLYELGDFYLQELKEKHDPSKKISDQLYGPELKGKAETYLKLALEIRQKESTDHFDIALCLKKIGYYYFTLDEYSESKACYMRALKQFQTLKESISASIIVEVTYDLGSICYKLLQFREARLYYLDAIDTLRRKDLDSYWMHCIEGNLALVMMQTDEETEGRELLQNVKEIIRKAKGEHHYDYMFLLREEKIIQKR